jgi:hypothetical protein
MENEANDFQEVSKLNLYGQSLHQEDDAFDMNDINL